MQNKHLQKKKVDSSTEKKVTWFYLCKIAQSILDLKKSSFDKKLTSTMLHCHLLIMRPLLCNKQHIGRVNTMLRPLILVVLERG